MFKHMFEECWHCGRKVIVCDVRHFFYPMFLGLWNGLVVGAVIGTIVACVTNLMTWAAN